MYTQVSLHPPPLVWQGTCAVRMQAPFRMPAPDWPPLLSRRSTLEVKLQAKMPFWDDDMISDFLFSPLSPPLPPAVVKNSHNVSGCVHNRVVIVNENK